MARRHARGSRHSIEGMDDPQAVREALTQITEPVVQSEPESGGPSTMTIEEMQQMTLNHWRKDLPQMVAKLSPKKLMEEASPACAQLTRMRWTPENGDGPVGAGSTGGGPDAVLPDREGAEPRPVGQGPIHRTETSRPLLSGQSPCNFVITPDVGVGTGTNGEKIRANLAAIRILKALRAEHRFPTAEEQAAMARYVGWGGLCRYSTSKKDRGERYVWPRRGGLREILTPDEYRRPAPRSPTLIIPRPASSRPCGAPRSIRLRGGRVLEPTVGVGEFHRAAATGHGCLERMARPSSTRSPAAWPDALLRPTSCRAPGSRMRCSPMACSTSRSATAFRRLAREGQAQVRKHPSGLKIHNYIIAKGRHAPAPGGIMQMVVTHRFLDTANPEARDVLAKDFRFLGAIRCRTTPSAPTPAPSDHRHHLPAEARPRARSATRRPHGHSCRQGDRGRDPGQPATFRRIRSILSRSAMDGSMPWRPPTSRGTANIHGPQRRARPRSGSSTKSSPPVGRACAIP